MRAERKPRPPRAPRNQGAVPDLAPLDRGNYPPTERQAAAIGALHRALSDAGVPGARWATLTPRTRRDASSLIRTLRHELAMHRNRQEAAQPNP